MKHYTTLNQIKKFGPCSTGWRTLLSGLGKMEADDEPLSYLTILEINGIDDAIWSLRTNKQLVVNFAISCAESVLPVFEKYRPGDTRVRECIETTKAYLAGDIGADELRTKRAYAWAAAWAADAAADAWAAARAASAAAYTADAAADADAAARAAAHAAAFDVSARDDACARKEFKKKVFLEVVK